jgi:hypothetical protein
LEPGCVRLAREDALRERQPVKCAVAAGGPSGIETVPAVRVTN